jgi:hypothetical protein
MAYKYKLDTIPKLALAQDAADTLVAHASQTSNKCEAVAMVLASQLIQTAIKGFYAPDPFENLNAENQAIIAQIADDAVETEAEINGHILIRSR